MNNPLWSIDLPVYVWVLAGLALVASLIILYILLRRLRAIVMASRATSDCQLLDKDDYPGCR